MTRPRIGLTTYWTDASYGVWHTPAALVPGTYVDAVASAGGMPVLLPPRGFDASIVDILDGVIVIGGPDVDPTGYGAQPHEKTVAQPERDDQDFALTRAALAAGVPLLAICRGAQVLNVAFGGTLHQHIPDLPAGATYQKTIGVFNEVGFTTTPGSIVAGLLGESATAACYHHQSIARLGDGLRPTAVAPDGTIEAVELIDPANWVLGVQFHPEQLTEDDRVIRGFVAAAANRGSHLPAADSLTTRHPMTESSAL